MTNALPINARQLKRQAKILLDEILEYAKRPQAPALSMAQEMISHVWRHENWNSALRAANAHEDLPPDVSRPFANSALFTDSQLSMWLEYAVSHHASSLHIDVAHGQARVAARIDGRLVDMPDALSGRFIINKPDERNARCWKEQVNTSRGIVGLTFQSVPSTTGSVTVVKIDSCSFHPRLDTLGMTTSQQLLVHKTIRNGSGIVVVAGTTGSGKSITANAIAHAAGLAGRKPLLVEEIRDESTLQSVHEYHRRTGGLIISTMLASSAISVFSRLRSMAPRLTEQLDLSVIPLVIYQTLRPRLCPACAINVEYTPHAVQAAVAQLADQYKIDTIGMRSIGTGCACCFDGTRGQTGIFEVIEPSYPMLEAISADNFSKAIGVWAQNADGRCDTDNMNGKFVMEHLLLLASQGIIDASAPVLRTVAM